MFYLISKGDRVKMSTSFDFGIDTLLGSHIGKEPIFIKTLVNFYKTITTNIPNFEWKNTPIQIFTGSNKSWNRPEIELQKEDILLTREYVSTNNVKMFIHSIYLINIGRTGKEFELGKKSLLYDLTLGSKIGALGVVVHVAKSLKMGTKVAIDNMYNNIIDILPSISPECPLIIETPAGQGTEVLTVIDEFIEFYSRFTLEEQLKIKVCIDTCHVHASGYDPIEYIVQFYSVYPKALILVHFNDSMTELGSKRDRHACPGMGFIGQIKMNEIKMWCQKNNIPMILEN